MADEPADRAEDKGVGTVHIGGKPAAPNWRRYLRIALWVAVAAITALFLLNNSQQVDVSLVFTSLKMPLFLVLFGTLIVGMFLGAGLWHFRNRLKDKLSGSDSKKD